MYKTSYQVIHNTWSVCRIIRVFCFTPSSFVRLSGYCLPLCVYVCVSVWQLCLYMCERLTAVLLSLYMWVFDSCLSLYVWVSDSCLHICVSVWQLPSCLCMFECLVSSLSLCFFLNPTHTQHKHPFTLCPRKCECLSSATLYYLSLNILIHAFCLTHSAFVCVSVCHLPQYVCLCMCECLSSVSLYLSPPHPCIDFACVS